MPPIFMCGPHRGPQVIQQNITIRQPGGLGGFLMGLFGGYSGVMPGMYPMTGYSGALGCVTPREQMQLGYYLQQMQIQQMSQYQMMNPMMMQNPMVMQNQYAYLNQMPQQQFLMDGDHSEASGQSAEIKNLETFFKGKDYVICPEADGQYTVIDKDGNLLASGSYTEVRDKLFEITKAEAEEADAVDDEDDVDETDGDDGDDETIPQRTQKILSGWYRATGDKNKIVNSINPNTVISGAKKEGQSAARYIVGHNILASKYYGALTMKQINALTHELISYNKDCFNSDGSLKDGFALENLAIPDSKWIAKYIIGDESITPAAAQKAAKTHVTKTGNIQYHANLMAQKNCRETNTKDVYYNDRTKTHVYYFAELNKSVSLPEVKFVDAKGNWRDASGKSHSKAELVALAEEKLEETASSNNEKEETVPDDDGKSDNTNLWQEEDD